MEKDDNIIENEEDYKRMIAELVKISYENAIAYAEAVDKESRYERLERIKKAIEEEELKQSQGYYHPSLRKILH